MSDLFVRMFPDSEIAHKFQMGATKVAYVVRFGLAGNVHGELLTALGQCKHFVLAFDESLNKVARWTCTFVTGTKLVRE